MASGESTGFKTGGANNKPNSLLYSPLRTHIRRNRMNNKIFRQYKDPGSRAIGISSGAQTNFVRRCLFFIFSLIFHLYFFINMYVQNNKKKFLLFSIFLSLYHLSLWPFSSLFPTFFLFPSNIYLSKPRFTKFNDKKIYSLEILRVYID